MLTKYYGQDHIEKNERYLDEPRLANATPIPNKTHFAEYYTTSREDPMFPMLHCEEYLNIYFSIFNANN